VTFVSNYELFVVDSDGTGLTKLASHMGLSDLYGSPSLYPYNNGPSISGDGSKIAFTSKVDGNYEIFVVNSDGTGMTQVTDNTVNDWNPSISDDGSKIAFSSYLNGNHDIFVVNTDGKGLTEITSNLSSLTDFLSDFDSHSISGDGTKIAFSFWGTRLFVSVRLDKDSNAPTPEIPSPSPSPSPKTTPPDVVPSPFPATLVIVSIVLVTVISIGLLVYFKKRKR
jgi:hypothetical protein